MYKIDRQTRDNTKGGVARFVLRTAIEEAMLSLSLEEMVLLMAVLVVVLLVTLTLVAMFTSRAHDLYGLPVRLMAVATRTLRAKKSLLREKKNRMMVLTTVPQAREEGKYPCINTIVCNVKSCQTC